MMEKRRLLMRAAERRDRIMRRRERGRGPSLSEDVRSFGPVQAVVLRSRCRRHERWLEKVRR